MSEQEFHPKSIDDLQPNMNLTDHGLNASMAPWNVGSNEFILTAVFGDTIVARFIDEVSDGYKTVGGLIVPVAINHNKLWRKGEVLMVGNECKSTVVGDIILFEECKGVDVGDLEINGVGALKKCRFLSEKVVTAKLNKKNQ